MLCTPKHKNIYFLPCFSSLPWNFSGVWWRTMFNIHFSVPANFVLFLYLDVFLTQLCLNEYHFFWLLCHIIATVYATHFRGHLEISFWKSHWYLGISIYTEKIYFSHTIFSFFWKIKNDQYNPCGQLFGTSFKRLLASREVHVRFRHAKEKNIKKL